MGLRTRLGGVRSVVRQPSTRGPGSVSDGQEVSQPRRRRSIDIPRLPLAHVLRARRAARAGSVVSVVAAESGAHSASTKSTDASTGAAAAPEDVQFSSAVHHAPVPVEAGPVSLGRRRASAEDAAACVPRFTRRKLGFVPEVPAREARREAGAVVSDGFVMFQVPDGWFANRTEDGFRLVSGACVGYIRATPSAEAASALCDTSRVAVLDAFQVSSSPVIDASGEAVVLVVEYRNYGAGRGLALLEPPPDDGACVFGLSGPQESARFLEEAEQQLLGTCSVLRTPSKRGNFVENAIVESSPEKPEPSSTACAVM